MHTSRIVLSALLLLGTAATSATGCSSTPDATDESDSADAASADASPTDASGVGHDGGVANDAGTDASTAPSVYDQPDQSLCMAMSVCLEPLDVDWQLCMSQLRSARRKGEASFSPFAVDPGLALIGPSAQSCMRLAGDDCTKLRACLGLTVHMPKAFDELLDKCVGNVAMRRVSLKDMSIEQDCSAMGWTCVGDGVCLPGDMSLSTTCQGNRYVVDALDGGVMVCSDICDASSGTPKCGASTPCSIAVDKPSCGGRKVFACSIHGIPYTIDCKDESASGSGVCHLPQGKSAACLDVNAVPCAGSEKPRCDGDKLVRCTDIYAAQSAWNAFDCAAHGWKCDAAGDAKCVK